MRCGTVTLPLLRPIGVSYPERFLFACEITSNMSIGRGDNSLLVLILSIQWRFVTTSNAPFCFDVSPAASRMDCLLDVQFWIYGPWCPPFLWGRLPADWPAIPKCERHALFTLYIDRI